MARQFKLSDEFNLFVDSDSITIEFDGDPVRPVSLAGVTLDHTQTHTLVKWLIVHFGLPWVPVTEQLPTEGQTVDVWTIGHGAWKGATFLKGNFTAGNEYIIISGVTHWLPRCKMEGPR